MLYDQHGTQLVARHGNWSASAWDPDGHGEHSVEAQVHTLERRRRSSVGYLVARLIVDAVRHNKLPRIPADHHSVTPRFARLVRLDVEPWTAFRSMAFDARVPTTRMVGVLVEHEAT